MDSKTKEELLKIAMAMRKARQWERDNPPEKGSEHDGKAATPERGQAPSP